MRLLDACPMNVSVRAAVATDGDFLMEMLVHAAFWRPAGPDGSVKDVLLVPGLSHYVTGWPRVGDLGVIAHGRQPVGAAWLRFFTADDPGYGFVDATIPEVSMGVLPQDRGRGVGALLIDSLVSAARDAKLPGLSLSVETDNYALRLYERLGFNRVNEADGSLTMVRYL